MTSQKQTSLFTEDKLTSSQEDFHANPTQWLESEKGGRMNAICGPKCLEQLEKFSHVGLWAKMFSALLIGQEGWYSTRCKLTWKLRGTKYSRMYFQLYPSTLPIEGIGFGLLLKTPTVMDGEVSSGKAKPVSGNSGTLAQEIMSGYKPTMQKLGLLPTPRACESIERRNMKTVIDKVENGGDVTLTTLAKYKGGALLPTPDCSDRRSQKSKQQGLSNVIKGMLPTPCASDWKGGCDRSEKNQSFSESILQHKIHKEYGERGKTSQLNPLFVAEMMSFPVNWTVLPFLSGETNLSKPMETQ